VSGSDYSGGDVEWRRAWPAEVAGGGRRRGIGGSSGGGDGELGSGGGGDGELESGERREGRDGSRDLEVAADWILEVAADWIGEKQGMDTGGTLS
jgi:hypothetical protein